MTQLRPMDLSSPYTAPMSAPAATLMEVVWAGGFVSATWVLGAEAQHDWARSLEADDSRMEDPFALCWCCREIPACENAAAGGLLAVGRISGGSGVA